jgi:hypothetical protein
VAATADLKRRRIAAQMGSIFGPGTAPAGAARPRRVRTASSTAAPTEPTPVQLALLAHDRGISYRRFAQPEDKGRGGEGRALLAAQEAEVAKGVVRSPPPRPPAALVAYESDSSDGDARP